jgi:peptidoglycan/LPS O-acetylase OafA/YrhL
VFRFACVIPLSVSPFFDIASGGRRVTEDTVRGARLPHVPGLNGLRGLAVAAVLLFHAGLTWIPGGQLGVTMFFTLSGFLITSLLLLEKHRTGAIALRAFWGRRARRLVPAMLVCFGLVAVVVRISDTPASAGIGWDAVAAATWTANWRFVLHHQEYADLFSLPSPFQHFWSLAVEEQFYVFFPLIAVLVLGRRGASLRTGRLALLLAALVSVSVWQAARLYDAGEGLGHAYYGTDARMAEILVGSLLALALVRSDGLWAVGRRVRWLLDGLALVGLGVIGLALATVSTQGAGLYRGWLIGVALSTAAVVAAAVQPGSWTGRVLSLQPLVGLGVISYGVYLFHWPLFLLLTESSTGFDGLTLLALRMGSTLALATLSYIAIEAPVRRGGLRPPVALVSWGIGATAGVAAVVVAAGVLVPPSIGPVDAPVTNAAAPASPSPSAAASRPASPSARASASAAAKVGGTAHGPSRSVTTVRRPAPPAVVPRPPVSSTVTKTKPKSKTPPRELTKDPDEFPVPPMPTVPPGALKVAVVGDSLGNNLGAAMHTWAGQRTDIAAYNLAIPACPLSKGRMRRVGTSADKEFDVQPVCEWMDDPTSKWYKAFYAFDPDVVVTEDGVNETFDRKLPSWEDWRGPEDPRFDSWLVGEYQTVVNRWRDEGRMVLMLNAPCGDWQRYFSEVSNPERRVAALNTLVYPSVSGVTVLDFFDRICPNGQYSDDVEGIPNARTDGFHFTNEAALALANNWLGPLVLQNAQRRG